MPRYGIVFHHATLGAIPMLLGRKVVWDPDKGEFLNDNDANRLRARAMRGPWHL